MKKLMIVLMCIFSMGMFTSCESCSRELKTIGSDIGGGLHRTAVLLDYQGDTIKMWEGKFDIRDTGSDNQIFFDLDGKRVWIQGGIFISEEK
jgi:hypothetical protein